LIEGFFGLKRKTAVAPPRFPGIRILVVDSDLLAAEEVTTGLAASGQNARFAFPATVAHLRDVIGGWKPEQVLLSSRAFDEAGRERCRTLLAEHGIRAGWYGGDPREVIKRVASQPTQRETPRSLRVQGSPPPSWGSAGRRVS
jgi:hypothetical protein